MQTVVFSWCYHSIDLIRENEGQCIPSVQSQIFNYRIAILAAWYCNERHRLCTVVFYLFQWQLFEIKILSFQTWILSSSMHCCLLIRPTTISALPIKIVYFKIVFRTHYLLFSTYIHINPLINRERKREKEGERKIQNIFNFTLYHS